MRVLAVAEKPSVAKEVARILSHGGAQRRDGFSRFNCIWEFEYAVDGQQCLWHLTSIAGHLMEMEFDAQYKSWSVRVGHINRLARLFMI